MNGVSKEPFYQRAQARMDAAIGEPREIPAREAAEIEQAISQLGPIKPLKPEPVTGRMQDVAEESAKEVDRVCSEVARVAEAIVAEGRELQAKIRAGAQAYEDRVTAFYEFAKGVTLNVREAGSNASTFTEAAE